MHVLTPLVVCAALLVSGCGGDDAPKATPSPAPTGAVDPFEALAPPVSPGVGRYSSVLATRAYQSVQGYLALQLLERPTLLGSNDRELISQLQGAVQDLTVTRDLGRPPTRRGLDLRPLFAPGVTLATPVGTVTDSVYTGDEVQGLGGEQGLRISWSGTVSYPVTFQGRAYTITYTLKTGYVFATLPQEPNGLALQQTVHGTITVDGVLPSCLAKGVLYPGAGPGRCPV